MNKTKLHIGCGDIHLTKWINIDCRQTDATNIVAQAWDLPYKDKEVDVIYACHVLEHFGHNASSPTAEHVLQHWFNILKPAGKCYISVPDMDKFGAILDQAQGNLSYVFNLIKLFYGGQEYAENQHKTGFNKLMLTSYFYSVGFTSVEPFDSFVDDTSRREMMGIPYSLNLVGTK